MFIGALCARWVRYSICSACKAVGRCSRRQPIHPPVRLKPLLPPNKKATRRWLTVFYVLRFIDSRCHGNGKTQLFHFLSRMYDHNICWPRPRRTLQSDCAPPFVMALAQARFVNSYIADRWYPLIRMIDPAPPMRWLTCAQIHQDTNPSSCHTVRSPLYSDWTPHNQTR